jgi:hypothetical protein
MVGGNPIAALLIMTSAIRPSQITLSGQCWPVLFSNRSIVILN